MRSALLQCSLASHRRGGTTDCQGLALLHGCAGGAAQGQCGPGTVCSEDLCQRGPAGMDTWQLWFLLVVSVPALAKYLTVRLCGRLNAGLIAQTGAPTEGVPDPGAGLVEVRHTYLTPHLSDATLISRHNFLGLGLVTLVLPHVATSLEFEFDVPIRVCICRADGRCTVSTQPAPRRAPISSRC